MVITKGICELCRGQFTEIGRREVHETLYVMLKCDKCNHIVARSD